MQKKGLYQKIYAGAVIFLLLALIWYLFFSEEKNLGVPRVAKAVSIFIVSFTTAVYGKKKGNPSLSFYEKKYQDVIQDSFSAHPKNKKSFLKAAKLYNQGKFVDAVQKLQELEPKCETYPEQSLVWLFIGLNYFDSANYASASQAFEKSLQLSTCNAELTWSNLGTCYQNQRQYEKALPAYEKALQYNPNAVTVHSNLATLYLRQGEAEKALHHAETALQQNPSFYLAASAAAMACQMLHRTADAEKYCRMYAANGGDGAKLRETLQKVG